MSWNNFNFEPSTPVQFIKKIHEGYSTVSELKIFQIWSFTHNELDIHLSILDEYPHMSTGSEMVNW